MEMILTRAAFSGARTRTKSEATGREDTTSSCQVNKCSNSLSAARRELPYWFKITFCPKIWELKPRDNIPNLVQFCFRSRIHNWYW